MYNYSIFGSSKDEEVGLVRYEGGPEVRIVWEAENSAVWQMTLWLNHCLESRGNLVVR